LKVLIYIFGEGDFENDALEAKLVPVFASHLKYAFEKNGVSTTVLETDAKLEGNPRNFKEVNRLLHSNFNVYDELRKSQEIMNNLNGLPFQWRNSVENCKPFKNEYDCGYYYGVRECADNLENLRK
jgi:hypothetical protein